MKLKLFYSLKRKVLAVCLAGMILMALCVGGISLWTISHLTYDYEIQNMNHLVDTKATIINDELLRSENIVNYAANSVSRKISDPDQLRNPAFQQRLAQSVDHDFQDATTNLHIICSYYLYYPSENISALWKASRGHDSMFYDVLAQQRGESGQAAPRHVVAFAYLMDQGKAAWTQPYYSPYLNRYIISYLRPIYEDGVMVAIIGVDLDFQAFIDRLYAKPSEGEEHGMIILSDATGTVEYSPKKPLGVPLVDKDIHLKDTADKVAEAGQTDNEMLSYTWAGEPSLAGIKTLRNGMNFIDLRQIPQIYDRTHKAFMQMGFGLVAVCILASLLPLYMISRLSERLQLVIEAAKEVGEGNYDVKLHDMHPDDIGELSRNFQAMAEKVIKAFSNKVKTFTYDGERHVFSVSIGYTLYKGDGMRLSRLFHQSDTALYAVKLRGRNHYRIYDATMENLNRTSLGFNLETITKNLPLALLVTEAKEDGKILFINKAMLDLLDCRSVTEFMAFTEEKQNHIICECDRERVRQLTEQQLLEDAGKTYSVTYCIRTVKGQRKHIFSVWRMADNPNYGRVFYATLVEQKFLWPFVSEHLSEDDDLT